jgi:hypothetical protein
MRPKIVIVTLAIALGLVGLLVILKGMLGGDAGNLSATAAGDTKNIATAPATEAPPDTNSPVLSDEARAAQIQKDVDQINELLAGGINPSTTSMLLAKLSHPEAEVRKAAIDALVQLNDTNAIPSMEQAAGTVQDPHEKVALLDAVAYLKLPSVTEGASSVDATPKTDDASRPNRTINRPGPDSGKRGRRSAARGVQPGVAPSPDQPQAASPATETQPAQ